MDKSLNESENEEDDNKSEDICMSEFGMNTKNVTDEKDLREVYIKNYGV